ncbi:hypothetical protein E2C01_061104 [Portunus trituberculatus]|uniref:Uncharacterized protein n=1 Tax=Portunus trituberculatus TaxID=210409 RepID=A0A5B7HBD5_PORTR|nr:hypothetical protein [Portunus trituberculatus]
MWTRICCSTWLVWRRPLVKHSRRLWFRSLRRQLRFSSK